MASTHIQNFILCFKIYFSLKQRKPKCIKKQYFLTVNFLYFTLFFTHLLPSFTQFYPVLPSPGPVLHRPLPGGPSAVRPGPPEKTGPQDPSTRPHQLRPETTGTLGQATALPSPPAPASAGTSRLPSPTASGLAEQALQLKLNRWTTFSPNTCAGRTRLELPERFPSFW